MTGLIKALKARHNTENLHSSDTELSRFSSMDKAYQAPLLSRFKIGYIVLILLFFMVLAYFYEKFALNPSLTINTDRLRFAEIEAGIFYDYIPVTGNVIPSRTVYIDAVDGGQVIDVHVEEGELVTAGQILVSLKNTSLQLEVMGREAQLTEQINNLSMAQLAFEQNRLGNQRDLIGIDYRINQLKRQLQRHRALAQSSATTQEMLDDLEAEYRYQVQMHEAVAAAQRVDQEFQLKQIDQLQRALDNMTSNIEIVRENLQNLTLKASINGQLVKLQADIGESKARGQRIGQIDGIDTYKVSASIDEFYLSNVKIGNAATVEVDNLEYSLLVSKVYPEITNRQFEIDLTFAQIPASLRRGQTMRLQLEIGAMNESLIVENGPFYDVSGGLWAFIVNKEMNTADKVKVQFGRRNPEYIEVLSGLNEGERIIISSYENYRDVDRLLLYQN